MNGTQILHSAESKFRASRNLPSVAFYSARNVGGEAR